MYGADQIKRFFICKYIQIVMKTRKTMTYHMERNLTLAYSSAGAFNRASARGRRVCGRPLRLVTDDARCFDTVRGAFRLASSSSNLTDCKENHSRNDNDLVVVSAHALKKRRFRTTKIPSDPNDLMETEVHGNIAGQFGGQSLINKSQLH